MISQYLTSLQGIEMFGIAGLLLSVACFAAITIWAVRVKPAYLQAMEQLPLDDSSEHSDEAER
jgi:hypothetical protein